MPVGQRWSCGACHVSSSYLLPKSANPAFPKSAHPRYCLTTVTLRAAPLTKGHLFEANFVPLRNVIDGTKPSETFSLDEVMTILSFQP